MTTATDSPLLALLGKGAAGPTQPGVADVEDKRALDAALEFAALLLDAGGLDAEAGADTPGGNALPGEDGKTLPVAVPVALPLKEGDVPTGDAAAPASATPLIEGARKEVLDPIINRSLGDALGGAVADEIRTAQAQPAVLQRAAPAGTADAAALAPLRSATVDVKTDARKSSETAGVEALKSTAAASSAQAAKDAANAKAAARSEALQATETARTPTAPALAAAARAANRAAAGPRAIEATSAARAEPARLDALVGALTPLREAVGTAPQTPSAVPQLAGPDLMPGEGGWGRQFAERVGWVIQARLPQAQLTLNPEHLGPIEMAIEVEEAQARVQFTAAHAVTRDAIEQSLPRLREMLEQQGLELSQADVSADTGAGSTGREPQDTERSGASDVQAEAGTAERDDTPVTEPVVRLRTRGLIDTFV
ncbi:MAG: flagellar hook-length control protein FliK [Pseudomonadota bacterium]